MGKKIKKVKSSVHKRRRTRSLVDALFTSTQQKVFRLIFGQPDRKFFTHEIIELAQAGSGAVQRELAALSESGLIISEKLGRQKYYRANKNSPIFKELFGITQKTIGMAEPIRFALSSFGSAIKLAFIFGSIAKGVSKAGSDIDILVVSDEIALDDLYAALEPVELNLSRKISPLLYSSLEFKDRMKAKNAFLEKVLAGERILLIGDENV